MIDLATETVIPLGEAPDHVPHVRRGRKIHKSTLYRWARRDGLETIRVGGTLCTSFEAIQRFCERLTKQRSATPETTAKASSSPIQVQIEARRRLDELRI